MFLIYRLVPVNRRQFVNIVRHPSSITLSCKAVYVEEAREKELDITSSVYRWTNAFFCIKELASHLGVNLSQLQRLLGKNANQFLLDKTTLLTSYALHFCEIIPETGFLDADCQVGRPTHPHHTEGGANPRGIVHMRRRKW
jgi:hypothetical protein